MDSCLLFQLKGKFRKELLEANVNISSDDFLEDTYDFVAEFGTQTKLLMIIKKKLNLKISSNLLLV